MTKGTESKLKKIGVPAGVAGIVALIVSLICQSLHG